jgi:hypothetical protein
MCLTRRDTATAKRHEGQAAVSDRQCNRQSNNHAHAVTGEAHTYKSSGGSKIQQPRLSCKAVQQRHLLQTYTYM